MSSPRIGSHHGQDARKTLGQSTPHVCHGAVVDCPRWYFSCRSGIPAGVSRHKETPPCHGAHPQRPIGICLLRCEQQQCHGFLSSWIETDPLRQVATPMTPETHYANSGDVNIAYQVIGNGPRDLILVPGWVSNIEVLWDEPIVARFLRRLTSFSRLILFDKRGTGLSDRLADLPDLETRMDDVRAVMDAVGSERAALCGYSEGGVMCMLFAATYPARTTALITIGTFARRTPCSGLPVGAHDGRSGALSRHDPEGMGRGGRARSIFAKPRPRRPGSAVVGSVPAHVGKPGRSPRDVPHEFRRRRPPRSAGHPCSLAGPQCRWRPGDAHRQCPAHGPADSRREARRASRHGPFAIWFRRGRDPRRDRGISYRRAPQLGA